MQQSLYERLQLKTQHGFIQLRNDMKVTLLNHSGITALIQT